MKIFAMFGTRKSGEDEPELLDAWDEHTVDENPDGYRETRDKWIEGSDLDAFAVVTFEVSDKAVLAALYPDAATVEAEIVPTPDEVQVP